MTFNALNAADEVIVPVETGFFCLQGLAKMMETLELLKDQCGKEVQIRVLPTLYDTRTKLAREVLSELRSKFQSHMMTSVVNFNTKLKEAASFGQPITEYDPACKGFKDFQDLVFKYGLRMMAARGLSELPKVEYVSRRAPAEIFTRSFGVMSASA